MVKVSSSTQSQFDDIEAKFAAIEANMAFAESDSKPEDLEKEKTKKEDENIEGKKEAPKKEGNVSNPCSANDAQSHIRRFDG